MELGDTEVWSYSCYNSIPIPELKFLMGLPWLFVINGCPWKKLVFNEVHRHFDCCLFLQKTIVSHVFFGEKSKTITHFHVTLKTPSSQPVILVQCNIYFSYKAPLVPPAYFGYLIAPACVSFVVHSIVCNLCYTRWGCWTLVLLCSSHLHPHLCRTINTHFG